MELYSIKIFSNYMDKTANTGAVQIIDSKSTITGMTSAANPNIIKAGEEFNIAELADNESFYSVLNNSEYVILQLKTVRLKFTREDLNEIEQYKVEIMDGKSFSDIHVLHGASNPNSHKYGRH